MDALNILEGMMTELEKLQDEINGRQCVSNTALHEGKPNLVLDVLFIAPPGGRQISIKPFGYTPEEIVTLGKRAGINHWSVERVSEPSWCIKEIPLIEKHISVIRAYANLQQGESFDLIKIVENNGGKNSTWQTPSCPYG